MMLCNYTTFSEKHTYPFIKASFIKGQVKQAYFILYAIEYIKKMW